MKKYYAYTRVSTAKQGEGVSLQEQRAAIERYAARHALNVSSWFEERVSAAKKGRPVFSRMVRLLKDDEADGVVIHKIDRSARNLRDWAELGELIDAGVAVHFADESLDMLSRSGRLSADIQAVVAADYVRNLREETRKGFYGRLKQGLYPLRAPIGYVDQGAGKPKKIDPVRGPLVRRAFELYDSGQYSIEQVAALLRKDGLKRRGGSALYKSTLSLILNNPFYTGLIRVRTTGETFVGKHTPLIKKSLFDRVQERLEGKRRSTAWKHDFLFRRLFQCQGCGATMTGERQKGHVYYRCHRKSCPTKGIREESLGEAIKAMFESAELGGDVVELLRTRVERVARSSDLNREEVKQSFKLQLEATDGRLTRLTDALIDGLIEKSAYNERRAALLAERSRLQEQEDSATVDPEQQVRRITRFFELAKNASLSYETASRQQKRELLQRLTSNRRVGPDGVAIDLREPFSFIAEIRDSSNCCPSRNNFRTCDEMAARLWQWCLGRQLASRFGKVAA